MNINNRVQFNRDDENLSANSELGDSKSFAKTSGIIKKQIINDAQISPAIKKVKKNRHSSDKKMDTI